MDSNSANGKSSPRRSQYSRDISSDAFLGHQRAQKPLKIIIVGAGLAGLALAARLGESSHQVIVLEAAPQIAEVGAGLTCAPNLTRLLSKWGLDGRLRKDTDALQYVSLRRWEGGEILGSSPLMPEVERKYGAPQYVVHRADIHTAMMEQAQKVADIRVNSMVLSVDFDKPSVTLVDGTSLEADVVVGADGMASSSPHFAF
jgi:salicylate hydroxylase